MRARQLVTILTLLLVSIAGTSLAAVPAHAVGCWGDWCSGQDPQSTGCSADARTLAADESYATGAYVELRYSPTCKTEWARVPRNNWPGGDSLGVVQDTGYRQGDSSENESYVWSKMIYSPVKRCYAWWNDNGWDFAMLVPLDSSDRELVHQIRRDAERWLTTKGTDQYQRGIDHQAVTRRIDRQLDTGEFHGWRVDGEIVAIIALGEPDPDLWSPAEVAEPQTYIHRLLVADSHHGKGYGAAVLGAVAELARDRDDQWIRLNCWTTNTRLHEYYVSQGFDHVRTVNIPGRMSGALFQHALAS